MSSCKTTHLACFGAKLSALEVQLYQQKFQRFCTSLLRRNFGVASSVSSMPVTRDFMCNVIGPTRFLQRSSRAQVRRSKSSLDNFQVSKVLVVPKATRYMFEQQREQRFRAEQDSEKVSENAEELLRQKLAERGSDFNTIKERHVSHSKAAEQCMNILRKLNLDVKVKDRSQLTAESVRWADLVVSMGGDGTYLLAASKVFDHTPVIGVNTDPKGSEGHLCLPNRYTQHFEEAMKRILAGDFRWKRRQRIRVTVDGRQINKDPIDLHELELSFPEHYHAHLQQERRMEQGVEQVDRGPRVLPVRALNEIFMGESLSSRMSYYEMSVDDGPMEKQKSSGVTISTGTGSSSWSFNINKLSAQSVTDILQIANEETGSSLPTEGSIADRIAERFNSSLLFDSSDPHMAYTVRDPVNNRVYQADIPRGFARKIVIRSRCWDASLVIDAGSSFVFNDGATATMEIHEEDALHTMVLD